VGSDRVEAIGKATGDRVGVLYDKDVAKRTNMPRDKSGIGPLRSCRYSLLTADRFKRRCSVPLTGNLQSEPR
jgi:hypothetical protein